MSQEVKASPKLSALCKWEKIKYVNSKLDRGESPAKVADYCKKNGFNISPPMMYTYNQLRKKAISDGINVEHMLGIALNPHVTTEQKEKLKSEVDLLDRLIQAGYQTLLDLEGKPISPRLAMEAIKLKSELTGGAHGFLTNYGMESLKNVEQQKYELIIQHLLNYIPEGSKQEAITQIPTIEYNYYKSTPYFEEYLRATGEYSENQIRQIVKVELESVKEQVPQV